MAKTFDVGIQYTAKDAFTNIMKEAEKALESLGDEADKSGKKGKSALDKMAESAKKLGKQLTKTGKSLSLKLTAPIVALGTLAAKTSIDFESAFTGVRKTVNATEKEFADLEAGLKKLALESPLAAEEIFKIAESAGQLGIKKEDILSFTKVMADLGATTNLASTEAATKLARFGNITGLASKDSGKLGSTIVDLGNNLATTEAEIVDMALRLGGAGKVAGLSADQIISLAGALSSVGLQSEAGGTAFSRVLKSISKAIFESEGDIETFASISGQSVDKFKKQWEKDAAGALILFTEGLGKIQSQGGNINKVLDDLGFESVRIADSLLRAAGSGDLFREALKLGSKAWKENTALTKEANLRYGTSASQLKIAWNQVRELADSFGDVLVPALLAVVDFLMPLVDWLKNLDENAKLVIIVIGGLIAVIGPLLVVLGLMATGIAVLGTPFALTAGIIAVAVTAIAVAAALIIKNWEPIEKFFIDLWKNVGETFDAALKTAKEKVSDWVEVGKSIVDGIIEGIKSAAQSLIDAAVDAAQAALSVVKNILGISSPSTVFAEVGKQMMAGMAMGIQNAVAIPQVALASATGNLGIASDISLGQGAFGGFSQVPAAQNRQNTTTNNQKYEIHLNGGNRIGIEQEFALEQTLKNLSRFDASL